MQINIEISCKLTREMKAHQLLSYAADMHLFLAVCA